MKQFGGCVRVLVTWRHLVVQVEIVQDTVRNRSFNIRYPTILTIPTLYNPHYILYAPSQSSSGKSKSSHLSLVTAEGQGVGGGGVGGGAELCALVFFFFPFFERIRPQATSSHSGRYLTIKPTTKILRTL